MSIVFARNHKHRRAVKRKLIFVVKSVRFVRVYISGERSAAVSVGKSTVNRYRKSVSVVVSGGKAGKVSAVRNARHSDPRGVYAIERRNIRRTGDYRRQRVITPLRSNVVCIIGKVRLLRSVIFHALPVIGVIAVVDARLLGRHFSFRVHCDSRVTFFRPRDRPVVKRRTRRAVNQNHRRNFVVFACVFRQSDECESVFVFERFDEYSFRRSLVEFAVIFGFSFRPEIRRHIKKTVGIQLSVRFYVCFRGTIRKIVFFRTIALF